MNEAGVSFRGLCAVNSEAAWASGSGGTFARTIDGGKTWQSGKIAGAEKIDFRDVAAFDEKTAVVFGIASPAKFYKTTDGGKNWKLVYENDNNDVFFSAASFCDNKNGIALSDPVGGKFLILQTLDGGENWKQMENLPGVPCSLVFDTVPDPLPPGLELSPFHRLVESLAGSGRPLHPWTVDLPARMRELAALGVASITTNEPVVALEVLRD